MAFISDSKEMRTFDPVRGVELIKNGGGSGGSKRFILKGSDFELRFTASWSAIPVEGADPNLPAPLRTVMIWKPAIPGIPRGKSSEDIRAMIAEALTAFKFVHGMPEGQNVEVLF